MTPCHHFQVNLSCQIFIGFSLENDDMESSKRCVKLFSLIFIIRCLTKSNLTRYSIEIIFTCLSVIGTLTYFHLPKIKILLSSGNRSYVFSRPAIFPQGFKNSISKMLSYNRFVLLPSPQSAKFGFWCNVQFFCSGVLEATEFPLLNLVLFKIYKDLAAQCKCL